MICFKDYEYIIWDFNGTILDDVDTGIGSVNLLLSRRGLPTIDTRERYHAVFGFPIIDYYRSLGFDFERESYDVLAREWVDEYLRREPYAPIREGVGELIALFSSLGKRQAILSATEAEMLRAQLRARDMLGCFDEVNGREDILADKKTALASLWRQRHPGVRALMIGDTVQDAESAEVMGADCILVAGGHQAKEKLLGCGAAAVFDDFAQLAQEVKSQYTGDDTVSL